MSKARNNAAVAMEFAVSDELPEGWTATTIGDVVVEVQPGFACGVNNRAGDGVSHLRPMNVSTEGAIDLSDVKYVPALSVDSERKWLRKGDVLFNNTNSTELVGKTALYNDDEPRAFSNHMTRVRVHEDAISPAFCAEYLHNCWRNGHFQEVCNQHVSQSSVSRTRLLETPISLPPLAEQKRIVAKVEALLARVTKARERLDRVPDILKKFRQSVLAAACSGRLTADWREENHNSETGFDVLRRLQDEHRMRWEAAKTPSKYKPAVRPCFELDCELPDTWAVASPEELCESIVDCPHSTPKWTDTGEICLRTTNFKPGLLELADVRYVSSATYKERIGRLEPAAGDVVYSREGGILGIACVIPVGLKACLGQRMMLLRAIAGTCEPRFMMHVLNSPAILSIVQEKTGGTASPHLNVGDIRSFPIPLPPVAEQAELVKRVDYLSSVATAIEQLINAGTTKTERIRQSVLAKAFAGELVETEADLARREGRCFEPASVLLERIAATRGAEKCKLAGRRK